jgi:hypothetical protein
MVKFVIIFAFHYVNLFNCVFVIVIVVTSENISAFALLSFYHFSVLNGLGVGHSSDIRMTAMLFYFDCIISDFVVPE